MEFLKCRLPVVLAVAANLLCCVAAAGGAGGSKTMLFAQVECTDSACVQNCQTTYFMQGECYETLSNSSAISLCAEASLQLNIFPFTTNCSQYSYPQEYALNECGRATRSYVEYLCPSPSSSSSSSFTSSFSKHLEAAENSEARVHVVRPSGGGRGAAAAGAQLVGQVPRILPADNAIVSQESLVGSRVVDAVHAGAVELRHRGPMLQIALRHPLVALWTAPAAAPEAVSRVWLRVRRAATATTSSSSSSSTVVVDDDVCASGVAECSTGAHRARVPVLRRGDDAGRPGGPVALLSIFVDALRVHAQPRLGEETVVEFLATSAREGHMAPDSDSVLLVRMQL